MLLTSNKCREERCSALARKRQNNQHVFVKSNSYVVLNWQEAGHKGFPLACTRLSTPAVFHNCSPNTSPGYVPSPREDRIRSSTLPWFLFRHVAQCFRKILRNS